MAAPQALTIVRVAKGAKKLAQEQQRRARKASRTGSRRPASTSCTPGSRVSAATSCTKTSTDIRQPHRDGRVRGAITVRSARGTVNLPGRNGRREAGPQHHLQYKQTWRGGWSIPATPDERPRGARSLGLEAGPSSVLSLRTPTCTRPTPCSFAGCSSGRRGRTRWTLPSGAQEAGIAVK